MIEFNDGYQEYIRSPEWRAKRAAAFAHYGRRCQRCGAERDLQIHHRTYARFRRETMGDLEVLCGDCHVFADIERKHRQQDARDNREMPHWAEEHYGPRWLERFEWEEMLDLYRRARLEKLAEALNRWMR
jgi:5-methylcytosine-specific restriction endonuclease McrA